MKRRKTPLRKCIVTNELKEKKELIRIVRNSRGEIFVDPSGKKNGRGAYLTNRPECFQEAREKDLLSRHLKVAVSDADYERLEQESKDLSL